MKKEEDARDSTAQSCKEETFPVEKLVVKKNTIPTSEEENRSEEDESARD